MAESFFIVGFTLALAVAVVRVGYTEWTEHHLDLTDWLLIVGMMMALGGMLAQ